MTNAAVDISIIIISWNMCDLLRNCLTSIYKFTSGITFEIILIDNNSVDNTFEIIKKEFPEVIIKKNSKNLGVALARNQGISMSKGRYLLILDADIELLENSLLKLYEFMEKNPDAGISGAKLVDRNRTLQYSCKRYPGLLALIFRRFEHIRIIENSEVLTRHIMKDWDHNTVKEVDYLIGACQFIRREAMDLVGVYDDNIFYGPEDIDYCLRMWKSGYKVKYFPCTVMIHHEQRITKKKLISAISLAHLKGLVYIFIKYKGRLHP